MPAVSVIMAYHRITPHLRPAVRSILAQTLGDLELIAVDNGTGQGLGALGEEGRDPRVRLLSFPENRGIAAAHNAAVAMACGEFIAMMDYDDLSLPARLERQVAALRADSALGLVFTAAATIDAADRVVGREFAIASPREHAAFSAYAMPANSPTLTARREVFARFPHRAEYRIAPDYDFYTRAAEAWPSRTLPEVLFHYRRHAGQTTAGTPALQVLENALTRLLAARRRAGRPEAFAELMVRTAAMRDRPPVPADTFAWLAERALEEKLAVLAAHSARRLINARRNLRGLDEGLSLMLEAQVNGGFSAEALRIFLTGPLRTHDLRPL
ncbi:glycosyltransferase family 2 protein [Oleiharenicola lentus]|nr:glycosyltransferase [Oleiharenicola lentus]